MIDSTEFAYPQEDLDHEPSSITTPLQIYHAPFSMMHIEEQQKPNSMEVNFSKNGRYFIPQTEEINREKSFKELQESVNLLTTVKRDKVIQAYNNFPKNGNLYGEYLPQTYKKAKGYFNGTQETDGKSVDPIKYITNLLVRRSLEHPNKVQEIVLHPDIIYFASQGRVENLPKVLGYLDELVGVLNQKLFFENISFAHEKFKEALGIFEDPIQIYNMVKDYTKLGIVVDIQHLEKSKEVISLYDIPKISGERMIIHSRKGYKEKYKDIYSYSVKNAIPWVIEE